MADRNVMSVNLNINEPPGMRVPTPTLPLGDCGGPSNIRAASA